MQELKATLIEKEIFQEPVKTFETQNSEMTKENAI